MRNEKQGGYTTLKFTVERYETDDGDLLPIEDPRVPEDFNSARIREIEVQVSGGAYLTPGYIWGAPEDCYPDDYDEWIEDISCEVPLTEEERESVLPRIRNAVL